MSAGDARQLWELYTLPGTTWGTNQLVSQSLEQIQRRLESSLTDRNSHSLAAEVDGRLVGSATLHVGNAKRRFTGDIGIIVHDEYVGRGIGRALMEALLDLADNFLGLRRVELDVYTDNASAIHLYESLGFQREGVKRRAMFRGGRFVTDHASRASVRRAGGREGVGEGFFDLVVVRFAPLDDRGGAAPDGDVLHAAGLAGVRDVAQDRCVGLSFRLPDAGRLDDVSLDERGVLWRRFLHRRLSSLQSRTRSHLFGLSHIPEPAVS
jgi:putative acetyltransferase